MAKIFTALLTAYPVIVMLDASKGLPVPVPDAVFSLVETVNDCSSGSMK